MHFHLPKPLHGWREFAGEVGIIVLGVLIALGAEQAIEAWHDRRQVNDMQSRLHAEVSMNLISAYERFAINRCLTARIAQLRDLLVNPSSGNWVGQPGRFGGNFYVNVMPSVYRVPNRKWPTSAWETSKSSGVIDKAGNEQSNIYSQLYAYVGNMDAIQQRERQEEADLGDLAFDTRLSDAERNQHLRTLARLDDLNARFINSAEGFVDLAANAGLRLSAKDQALTLRLDRDFRGNCVNPPQRAAFRS